MKKMTRQIFSVVATGSLLLNLVAPVSAMTLEVSGNGSDSNNTVNVETKQTTSVEQTNKAEVTNKIDASASTGGNEAKDNTGGNVTIKTGDATTDVTATTTVNSNAATVDCCSTQGADVLISGNGSDSKNSVNLDLNKTDGPKRQGGQGDTATTYVKQDNSADIRNDVKAFSKSGDNTAEDNTGGNVSIETGDATTSVTLTNTANANSAQVGGGSAQAGSVSLKILGNGADSHNNIDLDLGGSTLLDQSNKADVNNDVYAKASTGENEVKDNTSGEASIETGDAATTVTVDNAVNFNWAAVDCGCLLDVNGKISGNGTDTHNKIEADLGGGLFVTQANGDHHDSDLRNDLTGKAASGDNSVKDSTGSVTGDPSVQTGDAASTVTASNAGNSNVYGVEVPSEWPNFDFNFNFSLSLNQLLALLGH